MQQSGRQAVQGVRELVAYLRRWRRNARALLVTRSAALWIACAGAALLVGGSFDYLLRSPPLVRWMGLVAAVGVGVWAIVRHVWPAIRFKPPLTEIALRLERHAGAPGGASGSTLRGWIASALDLADADAHQHESQELRSAAIDEAVRRWRASGARGALRIAPAGQALVVLLIVVLSLLIIAVTEPGLSRIGAKRMLAPWMGAEWPRRQVVVDVTPVELHAIDEALSMRAAVLRTNRGLGQTPVRVSYRARTESDTGPWRTTALTGQKRQTSLAEFGLASRNKGELYERLLDPEEVLSDVGDDVDEGVIEYRFSTDDDDTSVQTVRIVRPPSIAGADISVTLPAYAQAQAESAGLTFGQNMELGVGDDARALVTGVLAGSHVRLRIRSSKPIGDADAMAEQAWLAEWRDNAQDASVQVDADAVIVAGVLDHSVRLPVELVDQFGFRSRTESVYAIDVQPDDPPEPMVTIPETDEQLIPSAVVDLEGQVRDDLGVVQAAIEYRLARRPRSSEGAATEPVGEWTVLGQWSEQPTDMARLSTSLDLSTLGIAAGDEVWLSVTATDTFAAAGLGREPVRSSVRRLRIIDPSDLIQQIRAELNGLRQTAMRLDEQQAQLRRRLDEDGATRGLSSQQAELTDRIAAQRATLDRLTQRTARNGLEDPALEGILDSAAQMIDRAAEASSRALQQMAQDAQNSSDQQPEQEQQRVRDELASLIDMLDRGEDGWVARRTVERLLEEQRAIMEQTRQAGQQTIGRDADQLTPQERTELDVIAERQRQAAQQAAEAIDQLGERSEQLSQADPSQSAAMAEAARQGRQQQIAQQLEQAAEDVQQNRTTSAQSAQQSAVEALEQMLDELNNAEKNRNAALLRQLASLIESLETLIRVQESQIESVTLAQAGGPSDRLDAEMIRLHENTLAVLADAQSPDLAPVRTPLESAGAAQASAIGSLRAQPQDLDQAARDEQTSLLKMREALAEAKRVQQQAQQQEQERIRRELRQAYRDQLEQEVVLQGEVQQLTGRELSRRDRATARGLGQRQQTIHDALDDLLKSTEGLSDAAVFDFAHRRLSRLTDTASRQLGLGQVDEQATQSIDQTVTLLRSLVEALAQSQGQNDFDAGAAGNQSEGGDSGGGNSGQQQQNLLPPIAELKLLRSIQSLVAEQTRQAADAGAATPQELSELAEFQTDLAEQARSLIERMQQQNQRPQPMPGGGS